MSIKTGSLNQNKGVQLVNHGIYVTVTTNLYLWGSYMQFKGSFEQFYMGFIVYMQYIIVRRKSKSID